jgi:hypothetical protein
MLRTSCGAKTVSLLVCLVGCSPQAGGPDTTGSGGVGELGTGGTTAVGSGGGGSIVATGGRPPLVIDDPSSGTGGGATTLGTNGGYVPLSVVQVADIKDSQCAGKTAVVEPLPAVLEFVVDVSDSMGQDVNGGTIQPDSGVQSKWEITRPVLATALDALGDDVLVGMQFYPSNDGSLGGPGAPAGDCVDDTTAYPIAALGAPGSAQRVTLATALDTTPLSLGTPTHDAYVYALENGLGAYTGPGSPFMVLITDGAPAQTLGCGPVTVGVDPQPIVDAVAAANAEGIKTFVIGSPGSQTSMSTPPEDMRPWLSDAATAGGTALPGCSSAGPNYCHLDMTTAADFATALSAALADIGTAVVQTCTFTAPDSTAALDLETTTVLLTRSDQTSVLVLPDADADCALGGWTRGPNDEVILCPATCDMVNADAGAEVSMSIGCNIVIK